MSDDHNVELFLIYRGCQQVLTSYHAFSVRILYSPTEHTD